jgi:hypothetical protein
MHPSTDPTTMRRRDAEFAKAETAADVDRLTKQWQSEDAAVLHAEDWRTREVVGLRQRVAALERLTGDLAKATGDALRQVRQEERAHAAAELERRGFVSYHGVWDEAGAYPRGALVTHGGSAWIALTPAEKGLRPGRAPAWRLAVKGLDGKGPAVA